MKICANSKKNHLISREELLVQSFNVSFLCVFGVEKLGFMSAPPARRVLAPGWWWWLWGWERVAGPWVLDKAAHVRLHGPRSSSCRGFCAVEL